MWAVCGNFSSTVAVLVAPPAPQVGFHFGIELACVTSLASKKPFLCCCAGPSASPDAVEQQVTNTSPR